MSSVLGVAVNPSEMERLRARNAELEAQIGVIDEYIKERVAFLSDFDTAAWRAAVSQAIVERESWKRKYTDLHRGIDRAVISDPLRPNTLTTLGTIYEMEEYRERCGQCRELECVGCEVSEP